MTIENIDVGAAIKKAKALLKAEPGLSPAIKSMFEVLILIITLLTNRLNLNSKNSSKPPSRDPNRSKQRKKASGKKPGGQNGHIGITLQKVEDPDIIKVIEVDSYKLPSGQYTKVGYESRQVFDIDIYRVVTEYRADIVQDEQGTRFTAVFPEGVTKAVQYGVSLKAHSVYMSQFQFIPYNRIQDYFAEQIHIPVSAGSIFNFNQEAFNLLEGFEELVKNSLAVSAIAHVDETGINIEGSGHWLHSMSNDLWTYFFPHKKRGTDAMEEIGILPKFSGILCHDHWKPYYKYDCTHALCNAHHLRELTRAREQDGQQWAKEMKMLLEDINQAVNKSGGALEKADSERYRRKYNSILKQGEIESPPPDETKKKGKRGKAKRTKARNLLERLQNYEDDVLRFMDKEIVPFTNNLGENDIRMTKVQQKISGCFRSMEGAKIFCRIRSYLSTCRKQGIKSSHALGLLFQGKLPDFIT